MTVRSSLICGMMLMIVALAGCLGGTSEADGGDASPTPSPTTPGDGGNGTSPTPEPRPPVARFVVLDNGTALVPVNGSYQTVAGANLTFDASGSSDPDGDNLTYAWGLGGQAASGEQAVRAFDEGIHQVTLTVEDGSGLSSNASARINATSAGPLVLFRDGADDAAEWTFETKIFFSLNLGQGEERTLDEEHPTAAGWHTTDEDAYAGTQAWTMRDASADGYHDHEWVAMVSPEIDLSEVSEAGLAFFAKGDAEANNLDGLYWDVSADGGETWTNLGLQSGLVESWTQFAADLSEHAGGAIHIRLLFKSDASCSQDSPLPDFCGAGEYKGYWIDEIMVVGS